METGQWTKRLLLRLVRSLRFPQWSVSRTAKLSWPVVFPRIHQWLLMRSKDFSRAALWTLISLQVLARMDGSVPFGSTGWKDLDCGTISAGERNSEIWTCAPERRRHPGPELRIENQRLRNRSHRHAGG